MNQDDRLALPCNLVIDSLPPYLNFTLANLNSAHFDKKALYSIYNKYGSADRFVSPEVSPR